MAIRLRKHTSYSTRPLPRNAFHKGTRKKEEIFLGKSLQEWVELIPKAREVFSRTNRKPISLKRRFESLKSRLFSPFPPLNDPFRDWVVSRTRSLIEAFFFETESNFKRGERRLPGYDSTMNLCRTTSTFLGGDFLSANLHGLGIFHVYTEPFVRLLNEALQEILHQFEEPVFELGAGDGFLSRELEKRGRRMIAVDDQSMSKIRYGERVWNMKGEELLQRGWENEELNLVLFS